MRIAIIGSGAAGLAAAWLLEPDHEVILFEKQDRLGGHADTVSVELNGRDIQVEAGFGFFSQAMFPVFNRLLDALEVPRLPYPVSASFFHAGSGPVTLLPPYRDGRIAWRGLLPPNLSYLLQLRRVLARARKLMETGDTTVTIRDFIENIPLTRSFKEDFLYPFLLAEWCVEPDEFRDFIAYNVLRYVYLHQPAGLAPYEWSLVEGGNQAYIRALAGQLRRAVVRTGAGIAAVEREGSGYRLTDTSGQGHSADHVVFAGNAREMAEVIAAGMPDAPAREHLERYEYIETRIAVHGDRRWMPPDERDWSVVNIRYDGVHAAITVWQQMTADRLPVFRSWVTFDERLPEPLYHLRTYLHPKINAAYFEAQAALTRLQGRDNLWYAGVHTHDVDCHESAVVSAVRIAQRLAPGSSRLRRLVNPL